MTTHLANYWSDAGHEVAIVCNSDVGQPAYPLKSNVDHVVMKVGGSSLNSLTAIYNNIKIICSFRAEVKRIQPDYIMAMAPSVNVIAAIACVGIDVVKIGAEQNYPPAEAIGTIWEILRKYSYALLGDVVAQTELTRSWIEANTKAPHVSVIHGPVVHPLDRSEPILVPDISDNRKTILTVGRLSAQKQFDHLIIAFREAQAQCSGWRLVILGEGELREELENLVTELDLSESILMPGIAGNVGDWYNASDIFAMSSGYEGFPNVLIEALTYGLPAVCYDCNTGPRDMISPPENGLLVPQDDIDSLSSGLLEFMQNDDKRLQAGIKARSIKDSLDIETICSQWVSVLDAAKRRR